MSEGVKLSQYDPNQIVRMGFDDDQRAQRVILIGGEMPEMKMVAPQGMRIERIEIPTIVKEIDIREVKVPGQVIVQKEVQIERIEVPQIIIQKEVEIKEIHIPQIVIQKEIQIIEIEKPVYIKELQIERVEIPVVVKEFVEIIKEVPVIQTEIKLVDRAVYMDRIEHKDLPKWIKLAIVTQALVSILMMSLNIWSKLK